jgi:hypothetical protein
MGEAEKVDNTAGEQEVDQTSGMDEIHPSIADMLTDNPDADALGGLNVSGEADDAPEEVKKGEEEVVEPPATEEKTVDWEAEARAFKKMALDERQKRQDLESQGQTTALQPEKADLFENPDERLAQEINPVIDAMTNRFLTLSESNARRFHGADKFNEAQEAFLETAKQNPALAQAAINSADPGEFQFQEGQKILTAKQLGETGGLDKMREQIRAEEKAKLNDLVKQGVEAKLKEIGKLPPNAQTFTGKNNRQPVVDTDMSLTDILGDR